MKTKQNKTKNKRTKTPAPTEIVYFKSDECGVCDLMAPEIARLKKSCRSCNISQIQIDGLPDTEIPRGLRGTPTMYIKKGRKVTKLEGGFTSEDIEDVIESL